MSRIMSTALAACLVLAPVTVAQAQDWRGTPVFGQVRLDNGFTPDPYTVQMTAGGSNDAGRLAGGRCDGNIGNNPDFVLRYDAGDLPLNIRATSSSDTTLVIRDPQGSWQCNDDTHGLDPEVQFPRPQSGTYHIWVGTYDNQTAQATLQISELSADSTSTEGRVDMSATATFGEISLRQGFTPDPHTVSIAAGGNVSASSVSSCPGVVAVAPDYEINYTSNGNSPLVFTFDSNDDTILLINAPDGEWYCDDDSDGDLNPRVTFQKAPSGIYDIWVGTISGEISSGYLSVSEVQ